MPETTEPKHLELEVSNFGPIEKAKIELRPLTVFAGPSNTGKSYLAMLVYALHKLFAEQAELFAFGRGPLSGFIGHQRRMGNPTSDGQAIPDGVVEELTKWVNKSPPAKDFPVDLWESVTKLALSHLKKEASESADAVGSEIERCFGVGNTRNLIRHQTGGEVRVAVRKRISSVSSETFEYLFTASEEHQNLVLSNPETEVLELKPEYIMGWYESINRTRWLNALVEDKKRHLANVLITDLATMIGVSIFRTLTNNSYYLPADRTGIMHSHRAVVRSLIERASHGGLRREEPLPTLSGVLADFLGQLIQLDDSPKRIRPRNNPGGQEVAELIEQEILKGTIKREKSTVGYPTFAYQPDDWNTDLPLMNTSSMVPELAPVVLYLRHVVQPGETLIIEEPEAHLHPAMQVEFIRQLAGAVRSGVRIMLITHSEYVLEELANLVRMSEIPESNRAGIPGAEAALDPDQVGAWLFDPQSPPGGAVVREIKLDTDTGIFPVGFVNITRDIYNRWAEINSRINESQQPND